MRYRNNTKKKLAGFNYFSSRRRALKNKREKTLKNKCKKKKKRILKKIKMQQEVIQDIKTQQELIKEREEFIKSVIEINEKYSVANPESTSLLLEKLGNPDLVEMIFTYNEMLNNELKNKLEKLRQIMQLIFEEYKESEHEDYIKQIDSIISTNNLDEKSNLIETILEEIKVIYESEDEKMYYGYEPHYEIMKAIEKILDEM